MNRDTPWLYRTYSGHSSAHASNALYKANLAKGQTGLSVAFDLPTQTGYDSDHPMARGEVGKVGVPICHIGDMQTLFDGIPLEKMNTSMTINATAPWLMALTITAARKQGADPRTLQGTTQNDILKEYLSRGTYIFPPEPSLKLTADLIAYTVTHVPKFNPVNVCPYHLQEAGATPVQELAYGLANAVAILEAVRTAGQVKPADFPQVVGRISFFLDSGIRFVEEMCKVKAFTILWKEICKQRFGVTDEKLTRFRYGVQVNSLGLTEPQAENNIIRIVLEALGVTLSRDARCRALQLPAWNESLGLPRPWDQQWSLRIQQILAEETDLLEYPDLFAGSAVIKDKVNAMSEAARAEIKRIDGMGGAVKAIESGYLKSQLVASQSSRVRAIEDGSLKVVGVNCYAPSEPSPLATGANNIVVVDGTSSAEQIARLKAFRAARDDARVKSALMKLEQSARNDTNIMPASITCAEAGVTTGEWAETLRKIFGIYRAPTGIVGTTSPSPRTSGAPRRTYFWECSAQCTPQGGEGDHHHAILRAKFHDAERKLGRKPRFLVAKPGLDGHSNGAEQIAVSARDAGFEVIYQGIRLTPEEIVKTAVEEDADIVGLSILSGSHRELAPAVLNGLKAQGLGDVPVVVGGIIPPDDEKHLLACGVKRIFTPKDFELGKVIVEIIDILIASVN